MKNKYNILALIPARGGSKGVPGKNIMDIAGQPLISYSIEQAHNSRLINRVIVSTDDQKIAEISKKYNAELPFIRPAEFSEDLSPDIDVFYHALTWLKDNEGYEPELVVHLRPTGPVRNVELIDKAINMMLNDNNATSLRSVSTPTQTPYKMWRVVEDYLEPMVTLDGIKESHSMPRQMLPHPYWQNGYVDVIRASTILLQKSMTGDKIIPFIVEEPIYEIDYPESIPVVEEAVKLMKSGKAGVDNTDADVRHPV